jgi:hypothetical protein
VGLLDRFFARKSTENAIHFAVRCLACDEMIRVRIDRTSELSLSDDGESYFVRKVLVGQRCFRPIEVRLRYADLGRTEIEREISGGEFVD